MYIDIYRKPWEKMGATSKMEKEGPMANFYNTNFLQ